MHSKYICTLVTASCTQRSDDLRGCHKLIFIIIPFLLYSSIKLNDAEDGCTVFITNIPFSIDNDQLKEFAAKTGPVKYALICIDRMTEHSKGSGFVKFAVSILLIL